MYAQRPFPRGTMYCPGVSVIRIVDVLGGVGPICTPCLSCPTLVLPLTNSKWTVGSSS